MKSKKIKSKYLSGKIKKFLFPMIFLSSVNLFAGPPISNFKEFLGNAPQATPSAVSGGSNTGSFETMTLYVPGSNPEDLPKIQKGDLNKYKNMSFDEFIRSLPIVYSIDRTRYLPLTCKNIKTDNPYVCGIITGMGSASFFKDIKREMERFCVAKGGYLKNLQDETIEKLIKEGKSEDAKRLQSSKSMNIQTCKIDGKNYFGYSGGDFEINIATPNFYKSPFDTFTAEPYLTIAKEKGLNIKEYPMYFEISGDKAKELLHYERYIELGRIDEAFKFKTRFAKDVLFRNSYLFRDIEISRKASMIIKKAEPIIEEKLYQIYPFFRELEYLTSLDIQLDEFLWAKIPYMATTRSGKVLILKPKEFKLIYKNILQDTTPLLEEFYKLVTENTSLYVPDREMFNY